MIVVVVFVVGLHDDHSGDGLDVTRAAVTLIGQCWRDAVCHQVWTSPRLCITRRRRQCRRYQWQALRQMAVPLISCRSSDVMLALRQVLGLESRQTYAGRHELMLCWAVSSRSGSSQVQQLFYAQWRSTTVDIILLLLLLRLLLRGDDRCIRRQQWTCPTSQFRKRTVTVHTFLARKNDVVNYR